VGGWRGALVAGALHAAVAGIREVFEPEPPKPQVVEVRPDPSPRPSDRLTIVMVPRAPRLTRAIVRQ
jgi:hypothetical protein